MVFDTIESPAVSWAGKSAPEVISIAEELGSVLVVPVGSIEQHGDHLPVATDTILANAVSMAGSEAVDDEIPVLVAPPVSPGFSPHHLGFGGTLTLEFETLLAVVEETVKSAISNGFDAVLLLNGHGGNIPLIGAATSTIGVEHPNVSVCALSYFSLAASFIDDIRDSDPGGMGHAGEFETSLLLHVQAELVDMAAANGTMLDEPQDHALSDMFDGGPLSVYRDFSEYSENGAIGDPTLASRAKGEQIMDRLKAEMAALLLDIHEEVS